LDRCALFVDADYALSDGALAVHGTRNRDSVSWDYAGLLKLLGSLAADRTGLPLLRSYWYDVAADDSRAAEHDTLADIPGVKVRLSKRRPGRKEGVGAEIHADLTALARNHAVSDVVIVTAAEDLAPVITEIQDLGIRTILLHVAADGDWTPSRVLRQECDDLVEIGSAHLSPYVDLISGAEPQSAARQHPSGPAQLAGPPAAIEAPAQQLYVPPLMAEYARAELPQAAGTYGGGSRAFVPGQEAARFADPLAAPGAPEPAGMSAVGQPEEQAQYRPAPQAQHDQHQYDRAQYERAQRDQAEREQGQFDQGQYQQGRGGRSLPAGPEPGLAQGGYGGHGSAQQPAGQEAQPVNGYADRGLPERDHGLGRPGDAATGREGTQSGAPGQNGLPAGSPRADLAASGSGANGLSTGGFGQGGLSQNGLSQNGLSQNGPSQGGPSQGGLSQGGLSQNGLSQNGPSQGGLSQNGLSQREPSQGGLSQNGLSQNRVGPDGVGPDGVGPDGLSSGGLAPGGSRGASQPHSMPVSGPPAGGALQHDGMRQDGLQQRSAQLSSAQQSSAQPNGLPGVPASLHGGQSATMPAAGQPGLPAPSAGHGGGQPAGGYHASGQQPAGYQGAGYRSDAQSAGYPAVDPQSGYQTGGYSGGGPQSGYVSGTQSGGYQRGGQPGSEVGVRDAGRNLSQSSGLPGAAHGGAPNGVSHGGLHEADSQQTGGRALQGRDMPVRPISSALPGTVPPGTGQPGIVPPGIAQPGPGRSAFVQPGPGQSGIAQPGPGQSAFVQPGPGQSAFVQPGPSQSGTVQPGTVQRGAMQPGAMQPGTMQPGPGQPGTVQPGTVQPGTLQPGPQRHAGPADLPSPGRSVGVSPIDAQRQPAPQRSLPASSGMPYAQDRSMPYGSQLQPAPFGGSAAPYGSEPYGGQPTQLPAQLSVGDAVQAAHAEGFGFGEAVARDAPALWLEAVLARKPRMPSDLEARLLQGSALPIDSLLHDEVRHALRRGFWDALERSRH
jgi:NYN domain